MVAMSRNRISEGKSLVLGRIGKVHGIKGWLKLISFTSPAENILYYTQLQAEIAGVKVILEIDEFRQQANGLLVHFKGYDNPEESRNLTGLELAVESEELPELQTGEYYWHQLQGMKVENQQAELFGRVVQVLETGANDVLVVRPDMADEANVDDRERLIPFLTDSVIKKVNLGEGVITVDWDADFLE
jgi:16S rRNA processing protein RimM